MVLRLIIIIVSLTVFSCNKIEVVVDGSGISGKKGSDTLIFRVNDEEIRRPMSFFSLTRTFEFSVNKSDSVQIEVDVPAMNYSIKRKIPYSEWIHMTCDYYFEDSLVQKYVTFDSLYFYHPDKLKFRLGLNDKKNRYQ
jgi:hypothetical protein